MIKTKIILRKIFYYFLNGGRVVLICLANYMLLSVSLCLSFNLWDCCLWHKWYVSSFSGLWLYSVGCRVPNHFIGRNKEHGTWVREKRSDTWKKIHPIKFILSQLTQEMSRVLILWRNSRKCYKIQTSELSQLMGERHDKPHSSPSTVVFVRA